MASAIVPYASYLARPGLRLAANPGAYVKYAPYVKAAARTIWRAYKMYRSRRVKRARAPMQMSAYGVRKRPLKRRRKNMPKMGRKYVGEPIGSSTAKSNFSRWVDTSLFGTRALNFHVINTTSAGTAINQRERTMINWRGTRICMFFRNTGNTNPINLNIAILCPKSTGAGNVPVATEFFRGDTSSRALDFGVTLSANEFRCRPINSDEYNILRHKRYTLAQSIPSGSGWNNGTLKNFVQIKWFIKAKRQIRYSASDGNTPTEGACYLVYWADFVGSPSGTAQTPNQISTNIDTTVYFRDPRN